MIKKLIAMVLLCVPFAAANAQHAMVLQKLNEWNAAAPAPDHQRLEGEIRKVALQVYGRSEACSISPVTIESVLPATADRFVFTSVLQQQLRNAWTVTARLPGCDSAPVRVMVMQDMADRLTTIRVNRGRSHAWDSLIGDTLPLAHIAAWAALKRQKIECANTAEAKLGVIRIATEDKGLGRDVFGVRYAGGWEEIWPIEACDRTVEVLVEFTADGDGGAYTNLPGERVAILPR